MRLAAPAHDPREVPFPPGVPVVAGSATMSMEVAFFAAADDEAALLAERRRGGPLGWPEVTGHRKAGLFRKEPITEELGPAFDGFAARGYDPVVNMGRLEELLTGRPFELIMEDARSGGTPGGDEGAPEDRGVLTLTDSLRDVLAETDDARLTEVVAAWMQTEELAQPWWQDVTQAEHVYFVRSLRDLAHRTVAAGARLYCYYAL